VHFCVLEALQNVKKYAAAGEATVRLLESESQLTFEVTDDGAGFDAGTVRKGSGPQNIEDRLDALGGRVEIRSAVGQGTTLAGCLPSPPALSRPKRASRFDATGEQTGRRGTVIA
jgi:signal transduction histidine kinase